MKKRMALVAIIAGACMAPAQAQNITTSNVLSPQELVEQVLVGQCVSVSNITYNGQSNLPGGQAAVGTFTSTSTLLPIPSGVVLSSGGVMQIPAGSNFAAGSGAGSDPDLVQLSSQTINDKSILEFDFIPVGDSIKFTFVFASTEYTSFTCTQFNDAFGFFLSGPGLNGPFSNNAVNLAVVPNSEIPITINTINSGTPSGGSSVPCDNADPNWQANSVYFVGNGSATDFIFNGLTVPLVARSHVMCGETYHIKLAIGDGSDGALDSGVFLEAGSFSSVPFVPQLAAGQTSEGNVIFASCAPVDMEFIRVACDEAVETETIYLEYSGTAIMGEDVYPEFPDSLVFEPGVQSLIFPFNVPMDGDGPETLIITVSALDCVGELTSQTFTFIIDEAPPMSATGYDLTIQCGDDAMLIPEVEYGFPPYTVEWTPSGTGDTLVVSPLENTLYTALITDTCGTSVSVEFNVELIPLPPINMNLIGPSVVMEACEGTQINIVRPQGVNGELGIDISHAGGENGLDFDLPATITIPEGNFNILLPFDPLEDNVTEGDEVITITATYTDDCGRSVSASVTITIIDAPPIYIDGDDYEVECDPSQQLLVSVIASGGFNDELVITWSHDSLQVGPEANVPMTHPGVYIATATDPCGRTASTTINVGISCELIIPNVFSPNTDGTNDTWYIEGITYTTNTLRIFDRWGKMVYETRNYQNNWRAPGLSDGTYFYEIVVEKHDAPYTGHLTILRNTW